ncbi:hypothetical protein [Marinimicrobium sp. ABcell2]|uniref:hypothetical protein n=1 Tax=Marinimicrobium sp. ABcell2 TaxID=3069751 RepID=UPI0027B7D186|nr:hypothetical protein [Marinimicrobium sp. ABcell2]MDQ2075938.1 hypothetical protein [Marinimicrobium sp. ABcell2]
MLLIIGGLSACALQLPQVATETYCTPDHSYVLEESRQESKRGVHPFPDLQSLVAYRRSACALTDLEQELLLAELQAEEGDASTMAILMLASCAPDQTPGLLANHLVKARAIDEGPPGFQDMVALLGAQLRSYSLVERRLRETEKQLERMITGIREIEAEMGGGNNRSWE